MGERGNAYHLGSGRLLGRQEGESEHGVRRAEVALQTEHEDVPVVERSIQLRLPLQSQSVNIPRNIYRGSTYDLAKAGQVLLVLQAEADDGGVEEGGEEGPGSLPSDQAREVPQLDVYGSAVVGADRDALVVGHERGGQLGGVSWVLTHLISRSGRKLTETEESPARRLYTRVSTGTLSLQY